MAKRGRKKRTVNKTLEIKSILDADASATPKTISAELAKKGIDASPAYVSTIKSKLKKGEVTGETKPKAKTSGARSAAQDGDSISIATLVEAKKLADKVGGVHNLKAAIDALSKLSS